MTTTEIEEQGIMDSLLCEKCNTIALLAIEEWENAGDEGKLLFHPIMGTPIHFVSNLAFRLGIGGTLCRERQGFIVE